MAVTKCNQCPRQCNIDRNESVGFCQAPEKIVIGKAYLHMWEEPCISGNRGSGTVFFSGCSLGCVFCQNHAIAKGGVGKAVSKEQLVEVFLKLQEQGANNINLVTPSHYARQLVPVLEKSKAQGLHIPILYNTGGYDCVETLKMLEGLVDIYMPDFKYIDSGLSEKYSHAKNYYKVASLALEEMVRQQPECVFIKVPLEEELMMKKGVLVRHLILPGCIKDSKAVLKELYDKYHNRIYFSIMNQYTPLEQVRKFPELNRKVTRREYDSVIDYAISLGIENAYIQEGACAKESFIPDFDFPGI